MSRPISDDRENARLTQMLLRLDESDDLTPEEEALAEGGEALPDAARVA